MRKISLKQQARLKEYKVLRDEFLQHNTKCVRCNGSATEVHHAKGRIGSNLLDIETFRAVCRPCHQYIETHPIEAKENNWSLNRY